MFAAIAALGLLVILGAGLASTSAFGLVGGGEEPLEDSYFTTITGEKASDGSCIWSPPPLEPVPGSDLVEQRQVSVNEEDCTSVIETGVPRDTSDENEPGGEEIVVPAVTIQE
jgi:hypothetical protein